MSNKNVTTSGTSFSSVFHNGIPLNREEQLDWLEQLKPEYLVVGPTRSGKTRPPAFEFTARAIQQGGKDDEQV